MVVRGATEIPVGHYGRNFDSQGVLAEEVGGAPAHQLPGGTWVYVQPDGRASKILCSELIATVTEDGPSDGRCGQPVDQDKPFACTGHAEIIEEWRGQNEAERAQWEREVEAW